MTMTTRRRTGKYRSGGRHGPADRGRQLAERLRRPGTRSDPGTGVAVPAAAGTRCAGSAGGGVAASVVEGQDARVITGSSARGTEGGLRSDGTEGAGEDEAGLDQKSVRSGVARLSAW